MLKIDPSLINRQPSGRWSALHQFAQNGDLNFVEKLVSDYGGNVNLTTSDGKKPHEIAREKGHQEVAEFLETGTTIKMQHDILDMAKYANTGEDWDRVFSMLENYPNLINVNPSGRWTILHQAVYKGDYNTVLKLSTLKADRTIKTGDGKTPLDILRETKLPIKIKNQLLPYVKINPGDKLETTSTEKPSTNTPPDSELKKYTKHIATDDMIALRGTTY